ncbi:MAG: PfkB family carbohydrate kinase [Acidimicrobiia bacterium]
MDFKVITYGEVGLEEIVTNGISSGHIPGGSALNIATALTRLGVNAAIVSPYNSEAVPSIVVNSRMHSLGVNQSLLVESDKALPVIKHVISDDGEVETRYFIGSSTQEDWDLIDLRDGPKDGDVLVINGTLAFGDGPMAKVYDTLFKVGSKFHTIIFDPNIRPQLIKDIDEAKERFDNWVSQSTIVKASAEDIKWRYPELSIEEVGALLLEQGPAIVVITNGREGSHIFSRSGQFAMPAIEIDQKDFINQIGVGDAFTAGLVKWLIANDMTAKAEIEQISGLQSLDLLLRSSEYSSSICKTSGTNFDPVTPNEVPVLHRLRVIDGGASAN